MKLAISVHFMLIGVMIHSFAFFSSHREWLSKPFAPYLETCAYLYIREATDHGSQSASIASDSKSPHCIPNSFLFSVKLTNPFAIPFSSLKNLVITGDQVSKLAQVTREEQFSP